MPTLAGKITPFLWFDSQAEEAAQFYTTIFKNARIDRISRYGKAGHETHGRAAGSVMTVAFELEGQRFVALNGGPHFKFNAGRNRLFLEQAVGRRRRKRLWLTEGQIRPLLASGAGHLAAFADLQRRGKIRADDGRADADEKVRHRRLAARPRRCRVSGAGADAETRMPIQSNRDVL
jgi:3-demethylubiquinone-9 3-methyltransferase